MVLLSLSLFAFYFSWIDIREHRIPNSGLLVFFVFSIFSGKLLFQWETFSIFISLITLLAFSRIGMGDIKLMFILYFFYGRYLANQYYCWSLLAFLVLTFLIQRCGFSSKERAIPCAPSIMGGLIYSYLAM